MATGMAGLPTGGRGQALAALLLILVAVAAWQAVAAPLLDLHADRAGVLAQREALARRMAQLAAELPNMGGQVAAGPAPAALLDGTSDAVAGATLQQLVQDMARNAGATLGSTEALLAEPAGRYRRIAVRVTLTAPWPALVRLLQSIGGASPAVLVDDLQLRGVRGTGAAEELPMDAVFTVLGFQASERT